MPDGFLLKKLNNHGFTTGSGWVKRGGICRENNFKKYRPVIGGNWGGTLGQGRSEASTFGVIGGLKIVDAKK